MGKDYKTHGVLDNKWTVLIEQKTLGRAFLFDNELLNL